MTAKDYEICVSGLTSTPYLAKVSKRNPNVMLDDRREITEGEILMLIDCYMGNKCKDEEYKDGIVCFKSHMVQELYTNHNRLNANFLKLHLLP